MRHICFLLLSCLPYTASAQTSWQMATPYGPGVFHTQNVMHFARDVEQRTGGRLTIDVQPGGSLIRHPEIKDAVASGRVPIGEVLLSQLSSEDPLFQVDSLPFLATDQQQARRLWEASRPEIERRLKAQGIRVLYAVPWPGQGLYSIKPLQDANALNGLYFRAYNPITRSLAKHLRAAPIHIEASEVGLAFALNRVEAMFTSASTGVSSKAWEYVRFYYDVQAWLPKNAVLVNDRAFAQLEPDIQRSVLEAARQAEVRGWGLSRDETQTATAKLRAHGMLVLPPSDSLSQYLSQAGNSIITEWTAASGDAGQRIMQTYLSSQVAQSGVQ